MCECIDERREMHPCVIQQGLITLCFFFHEIINNFQEFFCCCFSLIRLHKACLHLLLCLQHIARNLSSDQYHYNQSLGQSIMKKFCFSTSQTVVPLSLLTYQHIFHRTLFIACLSQQGVPQFQRSCVASCSV
jgi:hypothetical protein